MARDYVRRCAIYSTVTMTFFFLLPLYAWCRNISLGTL